MESGIYGFGLLIRVGSRALLERPTKISTSDHRSTFFGYEPCSKISFRLDP